MRKILSIIIILTFSQVYSQTKYVTTIHPFQEILKEVVGDRGEVHQILPPGASPHTYELRPSDLRAVASAKALFYGSENLDAWALKFRNTHCIELIKLVAADCLIHFEEEHDDRQANVNLERDEKEQHHHHASGVDPHFWTDPLTVKNMLAALTEKLCTLDPTGCEIFRQNSDKFSSQLDSLHSKIKKMLIPIHGSKVMISHPFFQYFFKRYGIEIVGVIESSPGREPTPREIKGLIEQIKHENVKTIFDHTQLPDRAAKIIAESTGIKVYHLDPIGGVPGRESYDELLLYNANIILEALR
jgi:zinc transport system substrate-binding protein